MNEHLGDLYNSTIIHTFWWLSPRELNTSNTWFYRLNPLSVAHFLRKTRFYILEGFILKHGFICQIKRYINVALHKITNIFVLAYLDNIVIYFKKKKDHKGYIYLVFQKLGQYNFYIKLFRCILISKRLNSSDLL